MILLPFFFKLTREIGNTLLIKFKYFIKFQQNIIIRKLLQTKKIYVILNKNYPIFITFQGGPLDDIKRTRAFRNQP